MERIQDNLPAALAFGVAKIAQAFHSLVSGELDVRVGCTIPKLEASRMRYKMLSQQMKKWACLMFHEVNSQFT